jgi:replicative DNA helicase Mcm
MQKLAIILALFGGGETQLETGSQIRGNINILLIGDGGTAKSQFLKTAETLAPKSVLASGKGATAAGLTATAEQSNLTGEWSLKAGALVMANNGVACIDEFDKMGSEARKSIHEALENQEVPVTKAGINTTLPAKTAVIAAANPVDGEFSRFDPLMEQVDMEQPLISRFDIIFGLQDKQDSERDRVIAETQHNVAAGDMEVSPEIPYDLLREYIAYARRKEPQFASDDVQEKLVDYYVDLRERADDGDEPGPRMNDSLRRLSQASARVRLSDTIDMEDAERAISMLKFHIGQVGLTEEGDISGAQLNGGKSQKERVDTVESVIRELDSENPALLEDIYEKIDMEQHKVDHEIEKLKQKGEVYEPETNGYRMT